MMKRYKSILGMILTAAILVLFAATTAQAQDAAPTTPGDYPAGTAAMGARGSGGRWAAEGANSETVGARQGRQRGRGIGAGQSGVRGGTDWQAHLPAKVEGELPAAVVDDMAAGLQDERNAYAIYAAVQEQFGTVRPFSNIQRAEAQHIAAWEFLFDRYELTLPAAVPLAETPSFATVADACQAAADAEIANFGLYDQMLATLQDYPDMVQVVTALRDASQFRHLPAFERCAAR